MSSSRFDSKPHQLPKLAPLLQIQIPRATQRRGESFWRSAGAILVDRAPGQVGAVVYAVESCAVALRWRPESGLLEGTCTCANFARQGEICAHIWATILAADETGSFEEWFDTHDGPESDGLEPLLKAGGEPPTDLQDLLSSSASARWQNHLMDFRFSLPQAKAKRRAWPDERQLFYLLDLERSNQHDAVIIQLAYRTRQEDGEWGSLESSVAERETIGRLADATDCLLLAMIAGASAQLGHRGHFSTSKSKGSPERLLVPAAVQAEWLQQAAETRRLLCFTTEWQDAEPLSWDPEHAWRLEVRVEDQGSALLLAGFLVGHAQLLPLSTPELLTTSGLMVLRRQATFVEQGKGSVWIKFLRQQEELYVPAEQRYQLIEALENLPPPPALHLPEDLRLDQILGTPQPQLVIVDSDQPWGKETFNSWLEFHYGERFIRWRSQQRGMVQGEPPRVVLRDLEAEAGFVRRLQDLGIGGLRNADKYLGLFSLPRAATRLLTLIDTLASEGWSLSFSGDHQLGSSLSLQIAASSSGGFELRGTASFGSNKSVELPELLQTLGEGKRFVPVDAKTRGVVPVDWLTKLGPLAGIGEVDGHRLRFDNNQLGLLDALLSLELGIELDEALLRAHQRFVKLGQAQPSPVPETAEACLREEQEQCLGWLHGLRSAGFGACLIEDVGESGKAQILALLEARRQVRGNSSRSKKQQPGPSLVVVPKALLASWSNQIGLFTPQMRVLTYTEPPQRRLQHLQQSCLADHDLLLTTYPILRSDISQLARVEFDYVVLDQAQAIKSAGSATTRACHSLTARHRLALLDTQATERLDNLLGVLDFLNPGLFGPDRWLKLPKAIRTGRLPNPATAEPQLALIASLIRPFIRWAAG